MPENAHRNEANAEPQKCHVGFFFLVGGVCGVCGVSYNSPVVLCSSLCVCVCVQTLHFKEEPHCLCCLSYYSIIVNSGATEEAETGL